MEVLSRSVKQYVCVCVCVYRERMYKEVWTGDRNLRVVGLWIVYKAKSL